MLYLYCTITENLTPLGIPSEANKVHREPLTETLAMNRRKMKMVYNKEAWELPDLTGTEYEIKKAGVIRYSYLKEMDKKISALPKEEKEELVEGMIRELEEKLTARSWLYGRNRTNTL